MDAKFTETYTHLLARVKASGWFGLATADLKTEWQTLTKLPGISLVEKGCSDDQVQTYHLTDIFNNLFNAVNNRTGLFAKELKPSGLPDAPGGGGLFGWSVSVGGGFESYTDQTDFHIDLSLQDKQEKELVYGLNFPAGGKEMEAYVKNLTDSDKPFPSSADFLAQKAQHDACRKANVASLQSLLKSGTINQSLYDQLISNAIQQGCHVDYTIGTATEEAAAPKLNLMVAPKLKSLKNAMSEPLSGKDTPATTSGSKVSLRTLLEFTLPK
jgi:hypothetical protein